MPDAPQTIGRYKVIRTLGQGGMGAVYLCQDPLLKRQVAVKTVLANRSDSDEMLERFQREAEISAQLSHPNIVTIFDVGTDPECGPFLTMEYVDGASLASLIASDPVPPPKALDLMAQAGLALEAAELAGVVHRDIKPENMMVSKSGMLKLTDFGVAREQASVSLTTTGMIVGTPTHISPEVLAGGKASASTDRYALAVTAFQVFTHGGLPHKGSSLHALMSHILYSPPDMPPDLPAPIARVFLKALHKEASRRYPTIRAFLEDLADAIGVAAPMTGKAMNKLGARPESAEDLPTQDLPGETAPLMAAETDARAGKEGVRLTGPPEALLKGPSESDAVVMTPEEYLRQMRLGTLKAKQSTSASRIRLPEMPKPQPKSRTGLWASLALLAVGLLGWNYWRGHARETAASSDPAPKFVQVRSDPPGAKVIVGTETIGQTPMALYIPPVPSDLTVEMQGYKPWHGQIGPNDPPPADTIKLERAAEGPSPPDARPTPR